MSLKLFQNKNPSFFYKNILEEDTGDNLYHLRVKKPFSNTTQKVKIITENTDKIG